MIKLIAITAGVFMLAVTGPVFAVPNDAKCAAAKVALAKARTVADLEKVLVTAGMEPAAASATIKEVRSEDFKNLKGEVTEALNACK